MGRGGTPWRECPMPDLDPAHLLHTYGYIALVVGAFLEGEIIVILAGIFAHQGYLAPVPAALCAFIGSLASDQLMFYLGRWKGNLVLNRFPRLGKRSSTVRTFLARHEIALILGFRFIYGVRNVTPVLLGMSAINQWKFLILDTVSAAVWATTFVASGYFFSHALGALFKTHPYADKFLLGVLIVMVVAVWLWRRRRG